MKLKRILIAEDDPYLSKVMRNYLEERFIVDLAEDGGETLEMIHKNNYAVVLLDLIMPVKNGFQVLEILQEEKNPTPVLIFSNLAEKEEMDRAISLGAKNYYIKSDMDIDEVAKAITKFTEGQAK